MSEYKDFDKEMPNIGDKIMMEVTDCRCGSLYYRHVQEGDSFDGFIKWRYATEKEIHKHEPS